MIRKIVKNYGLKVRGQWNHMAQAGRKEEVAGGHSQNLFPPRPQHPPPSWPLHLAPEDLSPRIRDPDLRSGLQAAHILERTLPWRLEASHYLSLGPSFLTCKSGN